MRSLTRQYIGGEWLESTSSVLHDVVNPATEAVCAQVVSGSAEDVHLAVSTARAAQASFGEWSVEQRAALLERIVASYEARTEDLASSVTEEMGCPIDVAQAYQVGVGVAHLRSTIAAMLEFAFEERSGANRLVHEPIGVVGLITPWNWPLNQIVAKVAPALAAGCSIVLKPSEAAPTNAAIFAEILDHAGVPPGVFNLVHGSGTVVGDAIARHPEVDMVSITGSTRAGILVAKAAADTVKRVHQELGGKSPAIVLDDADLEQAVRGTVGSLLLNSGQSCDAPTRLLVPRSAASEAVDLARQLMDEAKLADPTAPGLETLGPVANARQFDRIQALLATAEEEGNPIATGGAGRPAGFESGLYVKPTVVGPVANSATIAQEEVFGPVLVVIAYEDDDDAIRLANDTPYGLAAYVWTNDEARGMRCARSLKAGNVHFNGAPAAVDAPFGGYKQSGNGREFGRFGLQDFLELKALLGSTDANL